MLTAKSGSFPKRVVIIDTKYKLLKEKGDKKKSVSQGDLYQMVSYAFRRGCTEVLLIYPTELSKGNTAKPVVEVFTVKSGFAGKEEIKITIVEIPFYSWEDFAGLEKKLEDVLRNVLALPKNA